MWLIVAVFVGMFAISIPAYLLGARGDDVNFFGTIGAIIGLGWYLEHKIKGGSR